MTAVKAASSKYQLEDGEYVYIQLFILHLNLYVEVCVLLISAKRENLIIPTVIQINKT